MVRRTPVNLVEVGALFSWGKRRVGPMAAVAVAGCFFNEFPVACDFGVNYSSIVAALGVTAAAAPFPMPRAFFGDGFFIGEGFRIKERFWTGRLGFGEL